MTFPNNLIQGPLAGLSCAPFRRLTWQFSQPAFSCTEMISCKTLLNSPIALQQRFVKIDPLEGPVCFQLSSNNASELAEATKRVTGFGAQLVDLNCGCPVKKIRSKGAGSGLLTHPAQLYQLITAMKQSTHLPVSVKIRVEGNSNDKFNAEVAQVVSDAGADFLVVHGRHWTEHYETPCKHDDIRFFVETMKIPVIGNGDISNLSSLKTMLETGCAGVMIGRAGVGQPWLIKQLEAEFNQESFIIPPLNVIRDCFLEHVKDLTTLLNNEKFAVLQARTFAKYYARDVNNKAQFCTEMNSCTSINHLEQLLFRYFS
ncbi:MAG: tRNA-dihydrouridine synthase family protein [Gammaproteobacteria bacterium]|nr:tRNA-dihydrouridine synthase family protein [Gammaproteobacteria bacterium]